MDHNNVYTYVIIYVDYNFNSFLEYIYIGRTDTSILEHFRDVFRARIDPDEIRKILWRSISVEGYSGYWDTTLRLPLQHAKTTHINMLV